MKPFGDIYLLSFDNECEIYYYTDVEDYESHSKYMLERGYIVEHTCSYDDEYMQVEYTKV